MPKYLVHFIVENESTKAQYHNSGVFEVESMSESAIDTLNEALTDEHPGHNAFVIGFFKLD